MLELAAIRAVRAWCIPEKYAMTMSLMSSWPANNFGSWPSNSFYFACDVSFKASRYGTYRKCIMLFIVFQRTVTRSARRAIRNEGRRLDQRQESHRVVIFFISENWSENIVRPKICGGMKILSKPKPAEGDIIVTRHVTGIWQQKLKKLNISTLNNRMKSASV